MGAILHVAPVCHGGLTMGTSACELRGAYAPRNGDHLLLLFCDQRRPCFPRQELPSALRDLRPPAEKGAMRTAYAGPLGRAEILVKTARLDREHMTPAASVRQAVSVALAEAEKERRKRLVIVLDRAHEDLALAVQEGARLGGYRFDKYLGKKQRALPVLLVVPGRPRALQAAMKTADTVFASVNFARDVLNEPANEIHPETLAAAFRRLGRASVMKTTVWDEKRLARERCGGILAVGRGARSRPRLVFGDYRPRGARAHLCLVGKGVTFDTGGYCLKDSPNQIGMKYDMAGAAMMFGAACAIARLRLPLRISVITPLVQNDISSTAFHVNDILTTRSGRTVQVDNTDAEGRLILADALALAVERKPDWIVDAATLTGACVVALGEDIAGVYGTDAAFTRRLIASGIAADELFWELPLHRPYAEKLKSTLADTSNMGGKWGGSIMGALFLRQWIPDGVRWIHCDIAGPGIKEEPLGHLGKGAKGFGVKTIVALAKALADRRRG